MKMITVFKFFAPAMLALALILGGCAKEDPAKPLEVDWNRTAVVTGWFSVNADITKDRDQQKFSAPSVDNMSVGDLFVVTLPYSSLNSGASGTYVLPKNKIVYNDYGQFTITVPVGVSGSDITVKMLDFEGALKKEVDGSAKTLTVIWKASTKSGTASNLMPGAIHYFPAWTLDAAVAPYTNPEVHNTSVCEEVTKVGTLTPQ